MALPLIVQACNYHSLLLLLLLLVRFLIYTTESDLRTVEFMYPVFTCMPGKNTVSDSGLCCCVPCLLSTISPLWLLINNDSTLSL